MSDIYALKEQWSDETASKKWCLYRTFQVTPNTTRYRSTGFLGPTIKENVNGPSRSVTSIVASGDKEWAERTAKHYGISMDTSE